MVYNNFDFGIWFRLILQTEFGHLPYSLFPGKVCVELNVHTIQQWGHLCHKFSLCKFVNVCYYKFNKYSDYYFLIEHYPFHLGFKFNGKICLKYSFIILTYMTSVVVSPPSFLILIICVFFIYCLFRMASSWSVLLIPQIQVLVFKFFSTIFLFCWFMFL